MSDEGDFIAALRNLPLHPGARNLCDDAAVLETGTQTLVLTHDMLVEGVHFLPQQDPADIAWKLVATNLSDLAAKGAEPVGVLLGHMLGTDDARFLSGLDEVLRAYDTALLGGDSVTAGEQRAYGLTAIGRATHCPVPARSGANPGDALYITGPVGAAMIGYEHMLRDGRDGRDGKTGDLSAYIRPVPLLAEGQALAPHVTAMMDVSDGVLLDAYRLASASKVTIDLNSSAVPLAAPHSRRAQALRWGDDYQLLFTAPPGIHLPVPVHRIGIVARHGAASLMINGQPPAPDDTLGYIHRHTLRSR